MTDTGIQWLATRTLSLPDGVSLLVRMSLPVRDIDDWRVTVEIEVDNASPRREKVCWGADAFQAVIEGLRCAAITVRKDFPEAAWNPDGESVAPEDGRSLGSGFPMIPSYWPPDAQAFIERAVSLAEDAFHEGAVWERRCAGRSEKRDREPGESDTGPSRGEQSDRG